MSVLDEIERQLDNLPEEAREELAKILKERVQTGSVLDKLKHSADCIEAAQILLLNKTNASMKESCHHCGIRELCANYNESPMDREIKDCSAGIAKMLNQKFRWGEVFYDVLDKYGPEKVNTQEVHKLFGGAVIAKTEIRQKGDVPFEESETAETNSEMPKIENVSCVVEIATKDDNKGTEKSSESDEDTDDVMAAISKMARNFTPHQGMF